MDTPLKQRLIGAIVLVALAVIFLPMLVKGPAPDSGVASVPIAAPDALVMHPGPMNRGVEIDSSVADDPVRSTITEQVEMGVAVRMACLDILTRRKRGVAGWN